MFDARRPRGRFFYWLVMVTAGLSWMVSAEVACAQIKPATVLVGDVVYRADGTAAAGTVLISWPSFTTADAKPVAAGNLSVKLGAGGVLTVSLAPNVGGTPATFYTAVFQLDDGTARTEYWVVPAQGPVTLAMVRTTLGTGAAAQSASKQYVDGVVSGKANDAVVVHKSGAEVIDGAKNFSAPPSVPAPVGASDAANKAYVDEAVASVGAGAFVAKDGDAMTGPLTLSGDPVQVDQAATKRYVDNGLATKVGLVNGVVPPAQLGSGTGDASLCLKGNSSWGVCGGSGDASSIRGVVVDTGTPADGQVITYDAGLGKYKAKAITTSGNADTVDGKHIATMNGGKCLQSSGDGTTIMESSGACGTLQSVAGDLTVTGRVTADSFVSTGAGAWSVEGSYGTMTAAATGKSKLGFDPNGKLSVSENAGAVTEVAKKLAQQFTYTFFDPLNTLTTALQVPSIYVNRGSAFHIVEVYCEIDGGSATVNLQNGGANVLSADLVCTTAGASTTSWVGGKDAVAVGAKLGHMMVATGAGLHRVDVVVRYVVD